MGTVQEPFQYGNFSELVPIRYSLNFTQLENGLPDGVELGAPSVAGESLRPVVLIVAGSTLLVGINEGHVTLAYGGFGRDVDGDGRLAAATPLVTNEYDYGTILICILYGYCDDSNTDLVSEKYQREAGMVKGRRTTQTVWYGA